MRWKERKPEITMNINEYRGNERDRIREKEIDQKQTEIEKEKRARN